MGCVTKYANKPHKYFLPEYINDSPTIFDVYSGKPENKTNFMS